ncbi:reverse transcriptase family protein [Aporhodopirellula aestuarii]|uniref:RNA-directed DNA polymerase n=1 Tax=Aporhodopirellula aestuarii TaxID=2950107 RepID=A0ABT0U7M2_9BACT|nr:reverse transcriptase family protein [Aporhodopirellula aestuarii]MCM2372356.1 reverse transcriptase family protein [Aporhodopirellula aestuarii]
MSVWDSLRRLIAPPNSGRPDHLAASEHTPSHRQRPLSAVRLKKQLDLSWLTRRRTSTPADLFRYLGDGVSYELSQRETDQERLSAAGLPMLLTPEQLAGAIGFSARRLRWLAYHRDAQASCHYVHFRVPKKNGGTRSLAAPRPQIAACCRWIDHEILRLIPPHPAAHGFVLRRSTVTAAEPHVGQDVIVNMDLSDFFPTITFPRVRGWFASLGYSRQVATVLALLCTESPRTPVDVNTSDIGGQSSPRLWLATGSRQLPQGACTSPAISNLVCRSMDRRLTGLCEKLGWKYTRYADDLSFSTSEKGESQIGYLIHRVSGIVRDERFAINDSKTRIQRRNNRQSVTGLVVNDRVNVPRETVRRLRAILHHAKTEGLAAQNRDGHDDFYGWLTGMIGYVRAVDPVKGERLQSQLAEVVQKEKTA